MLINKFSQMTKIDILARWQSRSLGASIFTLGICSGFIIPASAQITYEGGKAAAQKTPGNFTIPVAEGKQTGGNLFHSFGTFGVPTGGSANFAANSSIQNISIQNIFGRVTGGAPSLVDGTLKVDGPANLFLMNPAGIVFGAKASLDINGAFTATTAKAIDFNGKWFNAFGANNYSELNGNPTGLAFLGGIPGRIFSAATFDASPLDPTKQTTKPEKSITLVGGTVISTGDIKTAGGNISIATVEGGKYVQIAADGSILKLDLPTSANNIAKEAKEFTALSLPALLTNTGVNLAATGVKNENGVVTLVGNPAAVDAEIVTRDKKVADATKAVADATKAADATSDPLIKSILPSAQGRLVDAKNARDSVIDDVALVGDPRKIADDIKSGDTISILNRPILSGDIITENLDTSSIGNNGGNIHLKSDQAILSNKVNTISGGQFNGTKSPVEKNGGDVVLNAQTNIKTSRINTSTFNTGKPYPAQYSGPLPTTIRAHGGNVTLSTQTKDIKQTGDIIIDSIDTSVESGQDYTLRGGNLTVTSVGLFRIIKFIPDRGYTFSVSKIPLDKSVGLDKLFSVYTTPLGKINITTGGTSFVTGAIDDAVAIQYYGLVGYNPGDPKFIFPLKPGFTFGDKESGSQGLIVSSKNGNGVANVIYTTQGFKNGGGLSIDGFGITSVPRLAPPVVIPSTGPTTGGTDGQVGTQTGGTDGQTGTEVAKNTSGDNAEEQNPKDNSDSQASKPGESEEDKQKAKKRKQKAKCNNSSAIASAKLGTDPTRSGNIDNSAAEELCPPNIDNGILQILIDQN